MTMCFHCSLYTLNNIVSTQQWLLRVGGGVSLYWGRWFPHQSSVTGPRRRGGRARGGRPPRRDETAGWRAAAEIRGVAESSVDSGNCFLYAVDIIIIVGVVLLGNLALIVPKPGPYTKALAFTRFYLLIIHWHWLGDTLLCVHNRPQWPWIPRYRCSWPWDWQMGCKVSCLSSAVSSVWCLGLAWPITNWFVSCDQRLWRDVPEIFATRLNLIVRTNICLHGHLSNN